MLVTVVAAGRKVTAKTEMACRRAEAETVNLERVTAGRDAANSEPVAVGPETVELEMVTAFQEGAAGRVVMVKGAAGRVAVV